MLFTTTRYLSEELIQSFELLRVRILQQIVATFRLFKFSTKIGDSIESYFTVSATFSTNDFASDWVKNYIARNKLWNLSRHIQVQSRSCVQLRIRDFSESHQCQDDCSHPKPVYEPIAQHFQTFRWNGYWMSLNRALPGYTNINGNESSGLIVLRVWTTNRKVIETFVQEARECYLNSAIPPRKLETNEDTSGSLLIVYFTQDDWSYDWMLDYLRSKTAPDGITEIYATTAESDDICYSGSKDVIMFRPVGSAKQIILYSSKKTGKNIWIQFTIMPEVKDASGKTSGGSITLILHSLDKTILTEMVEEARTKYLENKIAVHLSDNYGYWGRILTKPRRALDKLFLPKDMKEGLWADIKEFFVNKEWYELSEVPHRRGYLLHGPPSTGKTSTIYALAGELGLEIFRISLATPGIDDQSLARLVSTSPSQSILFLEGIETIFPFTREEKDQESDFAEDEETQSNGSAPPRSQVTLSGLLNIFDSVANEDGRIIIATASNIDNIDSALFRAGRIDFKTKYTLVVQEQAEQLFKRFFPAHRYATDSDPSLPEYKDTQSVRKHTKESLESMATKFSKLISTETYSITQLQGYLIRKKDDPDAAVNDVAAWLKDQQDEKAAIEEKRRKRSKPEFYL